MLFTKITPYRQTLNCENATVAITNKGSLNKGIFSSSTINTTNSSTIKRRLRIPLENLSENLYLTKTFFSEKFISFYETLKANEMLDEFQDDIDLFSPSITSTQNSQKSSKATQVTPPKTEWDDDIDQVLWSTFSRI